MEDKLVRVAITHGDTNGIGYEIILKTFADPEMFELCIPIVYGSPKVAAYHKKLLSMQTNFSIIDKAEDAKPGRLNIIATFDEEVKIDMGQPSKEAGEAALKALDRAMTDYRSELYDVLVTAPINKNNIHSDLFNFPGHTEYIEHCVGEGNEALMILMNGQLRVALVTTHLPIKNVAQAISKEAIVKKATILANSLKRDFRISSPRIAVLALNPHAGDNGVIGTEENDIIIPAINELEENGIQAFGPYPADGFFGSGAYGTAYDIAGLGKADPMSFRHAIFTAIDIFRNRSYYDEPFANPLPKLFHEKRDEGEKARFAQPKQKPIPPKASQEQA